MAMLDLQRRAPDARVIYASATSATEVANFGYAERLGLWGPGTAFAGPHDFVNQIEAAGTPGAEVVARDLKSFGKYLARSLSFDGVEYDRLEHILSDEQRVIYDKLAEGWQVVLRSFMEALAITAGYENPETGATKIDGKAKGAAMSAFWGAHQRFFNQVITSMQMPTALKDIERELGAGNACVLQLVNTNEAAQERALGKLDTEEGGDLEDLDMTPRDQLLQLIDHCYPTVQFESYTDPATGGVKMRPVVDGAGNVVHNAEAMEMKAELLSDVASIRVPEGPLEMLLNHFGYPNVAEVTGRKRRICRDPESGRTVVQNRTRNICMAEAKDFMAGKRLILVFSDAGGTGASYQADLKCDNQRRRVHYLIQPGWVADAAVQGFGRTHRSRQRCAPLYKLVCTDLKGQKRFISTIARRLDSLGALTKGQRQTASNGMFAAMDNLESSYARDALYQFYRDLHAGRVEGMTVTDFERETGLVIVGGPDSPKAGQLLEELPPITRFLNRLLSMTIDRQNATFDAYEERIRRKVEAAMDAGTYDKGVETILADKVRKVKDRVVFTDAETGSVTRHVELELADKTAPRSFEEILSRGEATRGRPVEFFARNRQSHRLYAFVAANERTEGLTGKITSMMRQVGVLHDYPIEREEAENPELWEKLTEQNADGVAVVGAVKPLWDEAVKAVPEYWTQTIHLLTGALLTVWDRLPKDFPKVKRLQITEGPGKGERLLGREIHESQLFDTLKKLGVSEADCGEQFPLPTVIRRLTVERNHHYVLANNWKLRPRQVKRGDWHVEVDGPSFMHRTQLSIWGCYSEKGSDWVQRWFVPKEQLEVVLGRIIADKPIVNQVKVA